MPKSELIDFEVSLINETDSAWLIRSSLGRKVWVPRSLCEMEEGRRNRWTLTIPTWLAEEKGLI